MNAFEDAAGGPSGHLAAQEALPWFVNGTLDGAGAAALQAHLAVCERCRKDLELLRAIRSAGPDPGPAPGCDPERALARLLPRLDTPGLDAPVRDVPGLVAAPAGRLRHWRTRLAANDGRWLRTVVVLQCGLIAVLALLLARPDGETQAYRGLGAAAPVRADLVVMFKPDTPEHELRRVLRASGAELVGGPTGGGAYLAAGADPAAVLARLRREPAVMLAEPLGTEGQP